MTEFSISFVSGLGLGDIILVALSFMISLLNKYDFNTRFDYVLDHADYVLIILNTNRVIRLVARIFQGD